MGGIHLIIDVWHYVQELSEETATLDYMYLNTGDKTMKKKSIMI